MDTIDNMPALPTDGSDDTETRATHRESLFLGVEIRRPYATVMGRIRNVSAHGALVEADSPLAIGEQLVLSFRGVDQIGATVVRKTLKGVGVRFEREIDPAICRASIKSTPGERNAWSPPKAASRLRQPGMMGRPRP